MHQFFLNSMPAWQAEVQCVLDTLQVQQARGQLEPGARPGAASLPQVQQHMEHMLLMHVCWVCTVCVASFVHCACLRKLPCV
jgi:hypothetical protein